MKSVKFYDLITTYRHKHYSNLALRNAVVILNVYFKMICTVVDVGCALKPCAYHAINKLLRLLKSHREASSLDLVKCSISSAET